MPVFDFNNAPDDKKPVVCTYTTFSSNEDHVSIENPILVLDNSKKEWNHHSCGIFTNQSKQTAFEFDEDGYFACGCTVCQPFEMAGRKSYQCAFIRKEYRKRICRVSYQGDRIWWRYEAVCGGWIPAVYD